MPNVVEIGLNNEVLGVNTYDVYVSECGVTNWISVYNDIPYSNFPVYVLLSDYGISDCYQYLIQGDTGCECQGIGWEVTPTPTPTNTPTSSVTPTITPTVTPTQVSPTPTPSITTTPSVTPTITTTPSVTPTITITPSVTPTISITPTITPTITITPTPTPLPCELVEVSEFTPYGSVVNVFSLYQSTGGANQDVSICDWINCSYLDNSYGGVGAFSPYSGTCGIFIGPYDTLPTEPGINVPLFYTGSTPTDCQPQTVDNFFGTGCTNNNLISSPAYVMISASTGTTIYQISGENELYISLYGTCDYYGGLDIVNGFNVTLNESNQWVINGEVNPTLNIICGQQYDFHICATGVTEGFFIANEFNEAGSWAANDYAIDDGTVTNNGESTGTISVTFDSNLSDNGGYWYGQEDSLTNYGQINFVQSCTGVTISNTNPAASGYFLLFEYQLCDGSFATVARQGGLSITINECIIPETITVISSGPNANTSLWNYSGGDCCS